MVVNKKRARYACAPKRFTTGYRKTFAPHDSAMFLQYFLETKFRGHVFRVSPRNNVLKRGTPPERMC